MRISTSEIEWDFLGYTVFRYGESEFDLRSWDLAVEIAQPEDMGYDELMAAYLDLQQRFPLAAGTMDRKMESTMEWMWRPAVMITGPWKTSNLVETVDWKRSVSYD
ncbi:hypothetical protein DdX_16293 [Ditylenchus destructor]|uniref:Uncharacterized protein n=1 Tax=Ditylenchus destructor TaxID=166010 RepID=A0AAD4QU52_9BILA|nr:hypothetical protein DdX_16293 [Ditylenchus destructor]